MVKAVEVELIARVAHEVNRTYCKSIGDHTQLHWDEAPEWQRDSAVHGVEFCLDNPESTPAQIHDSWMKAKIADGWVYGPFKSSAMKQHPCLVPYAELPEAQKIKDYLFRSVVDAFRSWMK